ncbi:MFS transporter [Sphingomonas sp. PP-CE-1G-424]|uniref:MFS transporter n=1 Tax=Sphingomonas sp. PP-CE-1G-424 TaxID=2135658 RepID=UPI0010553B1A|nr:MFS transporter [Sphingomonas sp. PP-CE-1G-424]TCP65621.1 putative MFS family arabinose efflux permease [Sphingomonas sp. PP-CE-1G-424]
MASITASADVDIDATSSSPAAWGALYAMTLCTFVLVASEFMPISLLSPIAHDLHLTEGQAGQAISISGLFAMVASLSLSRVIGRRDRRHVLLALTALLVVSGSLVALAPNYALLMAGRALLGIAIGGFWSMSAAIAMRLVPPASVPKALAVLNGGSAIAAVVGAPAGSFLGGLIGWRGAFFCVVPLAVAAVIWQAVSLPRLPYRERTSGTGFMTLLRRRSVLIGLLGSALFFMGQYSLYTYLRPFLERVTGVGVSTLSSLLLLIGVSGFIGTMLVGRVIGRKLHLALAVFPAVLALVAVGLTMFGSSVAIVAALLALWGLFATSAPVGWWTWVTRAAPDDPEAGGGLVVAIVQFSIMAGAAGGGIIYDAFGPQTEFLASAAILLAAVPIALLSRTAPSAVS